MALKDDAAFISAYEKINLKMMKSQLDLLLDDAKSRIEYEKEQKAVYANNLKTEETFFQKIKSGAKLEFGEAEYNNATIENQTITFKQYNLDTEIYDSFTYDIIDVSHETKVVDEQSTKVTTIFKVKDGSVIKMSITVSADYYLEYEFTIGKDTLSFGLINNQQ